MRIQKAFAAACAWALAGAAGGQIHQIAFELAQSDWQGTDFVDSCVAASANAVIVATNMRIQIFDPADGTLLDEVFGSTSSGPSSFPDEFLFKMVSTGFWRDPRVEYDAINDCFWITIVAHEDSSRLHVAVSVDSSPETFDVDDPTTPGVDGDWYVYTGQIATGAHGDAFHLKSTLIDEGLRFNGVPDHPVIHIDGGHLWVVALDYCPPPSSACDPMVAERDAIVTIPLEHGTSQSILTGQRPSEADLGVVQLQGLGAESDNTQVHYPVQEPFDHFTDGQLFINIAEPVSTDYFDAIRLGGAFHNSLGVLEYQWEDIGISVQSDDYFAGKVDDATTPSSWEVDLKTSKFDSGVLFKVGSEWRLLAGHHVVAADSTPSPTAFTEFRWYLIDPDLDNFPGTNWAPQIIEHPQTGDQIIGRAPAGGVANADTFQGAIAVNAYGDAYITFTRSGTNVYTGWPSLVRARLTADYSAVQYEVSAAFEQGPKAWLPSAYVGRLGLDYVDMQAIGCEFWAAGTLVADPGDHEDPVEHGERAIWLTQFFACNTNAEMNGDGVVDMEDFNLFLDHYMKETPQADMDGDGKVDSLDYLKYSDEYAKR
jgi:hypothetical protein